MTNKLLLCVGPQSSGTSFISWCFLQRKDSDGVLDGFHDRLGILPRVSTPYIWYKTTVSSFRLTEMTEFYEAEGFDVQPLLVVRDLRFVWNSLSSRTYGINGLTAEDPPLRIRLLRFKQDWEAAISNNLPIIKWESFVESPEKVLKRACVDMDLEWDQSMVSWPKSWEEIKAPINGSPTFKNNLKKGLHKSLISKNQESLSIGVEDLAWLETTFKDYNQSLNYAHNIQINEPLSLKYATPSFKETRRGKKYAKQSLSLRLRNSLPFLKKWIPSNWPPLTEDIE
tara:strand:- start:348 stop:1196 length:849 start_codon:yes stop_codon:yes gene_type:complete